MAETGGIGATGLTGPVAIARMGQAAVALVAVPAAIGADHAVIELRTAGLPVIAGRGLNAPLQAMLVDRDPIVALDPTDPVAILGAPALIAGRRR